MDAYEVLKRLGEALAADRAAGRLAPLSDYQRRYPGHDELVAGEYAIVAGDQPPSSGRINLEWLTTQHHHHYSTIGEIARGGMGAVFHIRDETLRRDLAMKVVLGEAGKIDSSASGSEGPLARRFLEEAQVTAQLDHPGVVPVHELGADEEGRLFFTMKMVKGRTLGEIFKLGRSGDAAWTRSRVLRVFVRVLETLAFAHDKGVIHRDLKPANIMVGDFGEVYVMDWGLAKVHGAPDLPDEPPIETIRTLEPDDAQLTGVGQVLGTPAYMPLEQAKGREVDGRTDIYAVGAMLYEYLSGCHPYGEPGGSSSSREVLLRLLKEAPPPAEAIAPDLPAELAAITAKAMAREPDDRYAGALDLARDLQNYVEGRVVSAHGSGRWIELRKWIGRNRALAGSIATAFLLLAAGLVVTLALNVQARREREIARRQTYRAALSAAVVEHQSGQFLKGRAILRQVPVELRGWIWKLLDARAEDPLLSFEGRSIAYTADSRLRFVTSRGIEEWDPQSGERRILVELEPDAADCLRQLTPDGALVVIFPFNSTTKGRPVRVLDAGSGGEVAVFPADIRFNGPVVGIDRFAWLDGRTTHVRELRTGAAVASRTVPGYLIPHAFSPDGTRLAVRDAESALSVLSGESLRPRPGFASPAFEPKVTAFSPDGRRLVFAEKEESVGKHYLPEIHVMHADTGRPVFARSVRMPDRIGPVTCSSDASRLAVAVVQTVYLVNPELCRIERTFRGLSNVVFYLALDPAGSTIAATDESGQGRIWATRDPRVLTGHKSFVYPVAFSPDGRRIASGGWDGYVGKPGCIRIWDAETGERVAAWGESTMRAFNLAFTPDGSRLLGCFAGESGYGFAIWDASTGETLKTVPGTSESLAVSPDGGTIAVPGGEEDCRYDRHVLETGDGPRAQLSVPGWHPTFSPDGLRIAFATNRKDRSVTVWDTESLEPLTGLHGHTAGVTSIVFSADGRRILTSSNDDTVRVWNSDTGAEIARLTGPRSDAMCAIFSPDDRHVIAGYRDGRIRFWDVAEREVIAELVGHREYVFSLALSPDRETLVSGSGDGTVRIWGTRTAAGFRSAIRDRDRLVSELTPRVERLFEELGDPAKVVLRVRAELTGRRREVALQLVLAESIRLRE